MLGQGEGGTKGEGMTESAAKSFLSPAWPKSQTSVCHQLKLGTGPRRPFATGCILPGTREQTPQGDTGSCLGPIGYRGGLFSAAVPPGARAALDWAAQRVKMKMG